VEDVYKKAGKENHTVFLLVSLSVGTGCSIIGSVCDDNFQYDSENGLISSDVILFSPLQIAIWHGAQLYGSRTDIYGLGIGLPLLDQESAIFSGSLLLNQQRNNYGIQVGPYVMTRNNYGILLGGMGGCRNNCGLQLGVISGGNGVQVGIIAIGNVFPKSAEGWQLAVCTFGANDQFGIFNIGGGDRFGGKYQFGIINFGSGYQAGLLNYNPLARIRWLPFFHFPDSEKAKAGTPSP